ncbi:DTW domain protein [Cellvibrio japonicus Ueda107]|uniref:tRNA-uridine aminocarboxypropyltransferase n=2 Tax=Cellvibrio japonicus TaxID=155077 RepID=B3PLP8_CELJU|nr:DTW domain protein [Cellvibrio japonicus Ueda107]
MPCRFESGPGHQTLDDLGAKTRNIAGFLFLYDFIFMSMSFDNQYHRLRRRRLAESTREFLARGKSVARCELCQLASYACICNWRPRLASRCEFVLLMHRDEVFKPTNTGRLIADVLPGQTHVFCWSRTEPEPALLNLLADPARLCLLVFPVENAPGHALVSHLPSGDQRIPTFILLDGTWKQSGRMFHLSRWLDGIACIKLPDTRERGYAVRKSHQEDYVSTAEAAALCMAVANEEDNARVLSDYFALFNHHYLATRGSYPPDVSELHKRLELFKGSG